MTNLYCDSAKADDSGDSLSMGNAKKHISAVLALLPNPITDQTIINLAGSLASPKTYTETSGYLDISDIRCTGNGELIIRPYDWNDANYTGDLSPFTGGASWDPKAAKPDGLVKSYASAIF